MNTLAEAYETAASEVASDPQSPRTSDAVTLLVEQIDHFLATLPRAEIGRLTLERRAAISSAISANVQRLLEGLRAMLSVALQIEELGGYTRWSAQLMGAIERLESTFARLGISVAPSKKPSPIVLRNRTSVPDTPPFVVANVTRRPQLEPYIAVALRDAQTRELEPGHWYADLEAFPGVWADGTSPEECLNGLADVLHEWLVVKIAHGDHDIPVLDGINPTTLVLG
jgi:predicted RNase H-like HicB family nuclease